MRNPIKKIIFMMGFSLSEWGHSKHSGMFWGSSIMLKPYAVDMFNPVTFYSPFGERIAPLTIITFTFVKFLSGAWR